MNSGIDMGRLQQVIPEERFEKLKELDYKELLKMRIDPKDLHFTTKPAKFEAFFASKKYALFLYDLIAYCKLLIDVEARQAVLEEETRQKGLDPPKVLRSDLQEILNKGKSLAMRYSSILLQFMADKSKQNFVDYSAFKRENELYEIFILLSVKTVQCFFDDKSYQIVEEEIHRLLRSTAFNESRRRNFELEKIKRFPVLEDQMGRESFDTTISKLLKRSQLPNVNWNFHYYNQKSDIKPNFTKMKPLEAKNSRSPLISLVAPSIKFRLHEFEKKRKDKISSVVRPSSTLKSRVPIMFESELNKEKNKRKNQLNNSMF